MLSIVIPTLNESKSGYLKSLLSRYPTTPRIEIICVDGGSEDGTRELIKRSGARLIESGTPSRAGRLNIGIQEAQFSTILLHHPRSLLPLEALDWLTQKPFRGWGAFTHKFDHPHPLLAFTSWYSNFVRGDLKGIFYLDHCLVAERNLLEKVGGLPEVDIFEDTLLCRRLNTLCPPERLPFLSTTSSIRFERNGFLKQSLINQKLKWRFHQGHDLTAMNQHYEKDLNLNTNYHD